MNKARRTIALVSAKYIQTLLYHTFDWSGDVFGLREFSDFTTDLARPAIRLLEEYIDNRDQLDADDYEILLIYADSFMIASEHIWQQAFRFNQIELRDKILLLPIEIRKSLLDATIDHIIQVYGTQLDLNNVFSIYHEACVAVGYCEKIF